MRRLLPDAAETTIEEQLAQLDLAGSASAERPYLATNFALTVDGQATISGRSGPIGSDSDTAMLVGLRRRADALMIGAGTMRAERYGPIRFDEGVVTQRKRDGIAEQPLVVIVSGRLDLPWDASLFTEPEGNVLVCTAVEAEPPACEAAVELLRQPDGIDLAALVRHLRSERGVRGLLCEGGPHLHAELIDKGLVDELFVTRAPKLAGGDGLGLAAGLPEIERPLELAWLLEHDGELFARYRAR
jgi:riboflavin-specific deaminase-like protein